MSLTLTLSGKSTILAANYFPAIDLSDGDYELGLAIFETYHTISNVNESNNKFYFQISPKTTQKLQFEGKLTKNKVVQSTHVTLRNNCVALIFDEIRYEFNGVEIDRNRNEGITSKFKNYVTVLSDRNVILRNAGWDSQTTAARYFNFCVPFYVLLGFCEDYKRMMINARHELILIRVCNDNNCLTRDPTEPTLELFKVQWRMPHVIDIRFDDSKLINAKLYLNLKCYRRLMRLDFEYKENVIFDRSDRFCASWLSAYHHGLRWEDGMVPYNEAERLITTAVFEHDVIGYVKGYEKRTWNLLLDDERERIYIETLGAVYEDMESLTNLDVANTMRYGQHVKICVLQSVLKIYN
ncbi:hypothetical protein ALC53_05753 [Atta colombica]|uniref:Double jelly roll-like domain-containing protein n=1 Tax=Atta colombica TaxID=520822 RepID=A0A151I3K4_9HYME|nr:hypothetical protein ALC53_05753 [Atta colombica]